jgi:hypothetical protein
MIYIFYRFRLEFSWVSYDSICRRDLTNTVSPREQTHLSRTRLALSSVVGRPSLRILPAPVRKEIRVVLERSSKMIQSVEIFSGLSSDAVVGIRDPAYIEVRLQLFL